MIRGVRIFAISAIVAFAVDFVVAYWWITRPFPGVSW